jgi:hypothetical protein
MTGYRHDGQGAEAVELREMLAIVHGYPVRIDPGQRARMN